MHGIFGENVEIKDDETIDDLKLQGLRIIQKKKGFRFAIDAVLLAHFATIKKRDQVIDLGTGTAVIPLLMSTRQEDLKLTGVEIQSEIVEMANRSIVFNKLDNIKIIEADLNLLDSSLNQRFNLVVSNPPYFPLNGGKVSSLGAEAIARHEIKCNLRQVVQVAAKLIKGQGRFALIHKAERLGEIFSEFEKAKIIPKRLQMVHSGLKRGATLVLVEGQRDVKVGLEILKPLIIYNEDGYYSRDILEIYDGGGDQC
ncbi:tRNA1(Val) A37 N6-methylase TrmN6 [Desulfonispora thiosulfatigenes DSM 11270]|uniref:tRNA1(Val) A37 N6-methylase TrmN6 n=1 Tax=Desulfonispora thiosulfatigenes DSM 11270 TaxID=656914 RepID=A0A1W1V0Q8_DESTI|nr:tRNA1(Val) (adenine(37)-N6)-methyltransferase [Desulfonispora thiosulfatigenes]SMB86927.1 tRNA1(Val) A37 N6-methylase TrmN6 [Desulfonispora thiosulfatigenes DSM 11270]